MDEREFMSDWQGERNQARTSRHGEKNQSSGLVALFEPTNRLLLFSVLCSSVLLFSFNNCSEVNFPVASNGGVESGSSDPDSGFKAQYESDKGYIGKWVSGLDEISTRRFELAASGDDLLIEAADLQPSDMRESGVYKTFHYQVSSENLVDLCDDRRSQVLYSDCRAGSISSQAQKVAIITKDALLGTQDRDRLEDIYFVNVITGDRQVFSGGVSGDQIVGKVVEATLSTDGKTLAFVTSHWREDEESQSFRQVYVKSGQNKFVRAASVSRTGELANSDCWGVSLNDDASLLLFHSSATNLLPEVDDGNDHIFLKNLKTGQLTWVDEPITGTTFREDTHSFGGQLSGNGRYVIFASEAENLVEDDRNGFVDVFVRDVRSRRTALISRTFSGRQGQGDCLEPAISRDGGVALFSCAPLSFGLSDSMESSEVFLALPELKKIKPLSLPDSAPWRVEQLELTADGRQAVLGLRSALEPKEYRGISLIRYSFVKSD